MKNKLDLNKGIVVSTIEDLDDLWHLKQVVEPGDEVRGTCERKIKIGQGENTKVTRKKFTATILIEKIDFHVSTNALRLNGTILRAPEDIPLGSYQTLSAELNTTISIKKKRWLSYHLSKLKESEKKRSKLLIVVFDREEALFNESKITGFKTLLTLKGSVTKKAEPSIKSTNFYSQILKTVMDLDSTKSYDHIIAASPSFWKEYLKKELEKPLFESIKSKISITSSSDVSTSAVYSILKNKDLQSMLKSDRSRVEDEYIDNLLANLGKDMAFVGLTETKSNLDAGNVKELFISDNFLLKYKENGTFFKIESILKTVESLNAKVRIISSDLALKQLDGLSGIAGILRWKN